MPIGLRLRQSPFVTRPPIHSGFGSLSARVRMTMPIRLPASGVCCPAGRLGRLRPLESRPSPGGGGLYVRNKPFGVLALLGEAVPGARHHDQNRSGFGGIRLIRHAEAIPPHGGDTTDQRYATFLLPGPDAETREGQIGYGGPLPGRPGRWLEARPPQSLSPWTMVSCRRWCFGHGRWGWPFEAGVNVSDPLISVATQFASL
jgi:hypothetical protein